jgi:hypothetical protein
MPGGSERNLAYVGDAVAFVPELGEAERLVLADAQTSGGLLMAVAADETDGYKFGTPFAITFGGGLKFVAGGRLQLRADVGERLFKQKYPDTYYKTASDNTAVLTTTPRSIWTNHSLLTLGVSFLFDR